ncbi:MAG: hypothetical protein ACRECU_03545 [Methylocella sp.]
MGDDREERIRDDWYRTYKSWDHADDRRRVERENQITRLGLEGARLGREIERAEQASRLKERIADFLRYKKDALRNIDGAWVAADKKSEWYRHLETIDARTQGAESELTNLLESVRAYGRAWSSNGLQWPEGPVFNHEPRSWAQDPWKRLEGLKVEVTFRESTKTGLNSLESSLNLLIERCQAAHKYMG